jgi:hypothetical protein
LKQALLLRLAVLGGSWTLEAAKAVCSSDDLLSKAVLDVVFHLIEKFPVQVSGS